ncbi:hypothetical protein Rsub_07740 [Raphidocelis subcapitata]|uniref:Rab-GAP TBC domain-containing protein n=1 Tax=Raphidocelis subcapitata TaxID=307507 RepID=A0A2V0P5N0_9CHLO|nr:hypothetical protein Rsub_07740 [Raphidocelis subcapitata]|eukprot:GBF95156.1 hypothetical protein Rsub_07740 [Raphidocelis subcapitata]
MEGGDEPRSPSRPSSRRGGLRERVTEAAGLLLRAAASAGELLADPDLRKRGAALIIGEASKGIQGIQRGIEEGANNTFGVGVKRVQAVLRDIERKVAEFQRLQRARDAACATDALARQPVDVQIGLSVYEDMPQEMRARLYWVLCHRPDLAEKLQEQIRMVTSLPGPKETPHVRLSAAPSAAEPAAAAADEASPGAGGSAQEGGAAGADQRQEEQQLAEQQREESAAVGDAAEAEPAGDEAEDASAAPGSPSAPAGSPEKRQLQEAVHTQPAGAEEEREGEEEAQGQAEGADSEDSGKPPAGAPPRLPGSHPIEAGDEWEVLNRDAVGGAVGDSGAVEAAETLRTLAASLREAGTLDAARALQVELFDAMLAAPWDPETSLPSDPEPGGEYASLVAAPAADAVQRCMGGVEPVADVIGRDLGRTFPEHPLFTDGDGQARLGRLLRAYALRDEETGYCQGQAFAAGLLLMFVPEETAFTLYCRLMDDAPAGAGLRRLYAPGLEPLKLELSTFELLLASHLPALHAHLQSAGLPAVLYASQWFMTLFAAPFPVHVSARVVDALLQSRDDGVLPRVGLALLEALQGELLALDDFEAIITSVKVTPLSWPVAVYRHVLDRALSAELLPDAELAAARAAAAAESARLGRPSSFSTRRLVRTLGSDGVTERMELTPLADGGAAAPPGGRAAGAAVGAGAPAGLVDGAGSRTAAASAAGLPPTWGAGEGGAAGGAASAGAGAGAAGASGSAAASALPELSGMAAEFEAILQDLDLLLPGGADAHAPGASGAPSGGAPGAEGAGASAQVEGGAR